MSPNPTFHRHPAGEAANNSSRCSRFQLAAACVSEQLFDMTGRRPRHRTNKLKGKARQSERQVRHRTSPKVRVRKPDLSSPTPNALPHTPSDSVTFWVLRYYALSSVGLYGSLWLLSCVSVQGLEILVVFPVFAPLSCYLLVHVAHEPC